MYEAAQLATDRRAFRTARRRLDRKQQRVKQVQALFACEIAKIDSRFYIRQQESALFRDEVEDAFPLFNDPQYTDREYHKQYPTIHHLIVDLMNSKAPHDVRLVYLACSWLVSHRGHFLNEFAKDNIAAITRFDNVYKSFRAFFINQDFMIPWKEEAEEAAYIGQILRKNISLTQKYRELAAACFDTKVPKEATESFPYNCEVLLKCLCGSKVSAEKLFANAAYEPIKSFTLGDDDEALAEVLEQLGDDAELIITMKSLFDWSVLVDILGNASSISQAKVDLYEQHKADLAHLKAFIRKYAPEHYRKLFRETDGGGYATYIGHSNEKQAKKKMGKEDFLKALEKTVKTITPQECDEPFLTDMTQRIATRRFLPKQRDTDNRVIPYQLYWHELDVLLKNAVHYLPFLGEVSDGLSVADKLRSILTFRIPYFVGPLNNASNRAWVQWTDKKAGPILPWNFEQQVDLDASEQLFINRMINSCTYLPSERVLPKDSLIYHRFMVLNEINLIKIDETPITVAQKQALYNELFMARRKVTYKQIESWLLSNGIMQRGQKLSGIDIQIKADLKPQHDFRRLLESGQLSEAQAETIIERSAYCEDKLRLNKWLAANYPLLPKEDIRYLSSLRYKDFGRLSKRFLNALEGVEYQTGEVFTIMSALWNTNHNMMELLSDKFSFLEVVQQEQEDYYRAHPKTLTERLDEMYISNAVKRPVIRALEIVKEVTKAFQHPPEKIFIEMARGSSPQQKGKRTQSRKEQLLQFFSGTWDNDLQLLRKQIEDMGDSCDNRLQADRLYLYFMQMGRCLYTGEAIDIAQLAGDQYNIEHIYPQSMVKDDSLLNNVILVDSKANGDKSDSYPVAPSIQQKCDALWRKLNTHHLLSDEKLRRLTRTTPFSDDEKWGFINRQLTQTTQSTKAVATLLKEKYPQTEIVYVKAQLGSEFRQTFNCIKSRVFNDLHHAKDAYLNIVTGNVYHSRFSKRWFIPSKGDYNVKAAKLFTNPVVCGGETIWRGTEDLDRVKAVLQRNHAHLTRYAFCRQGGFFDQMPVKAAAGLIPLKAGLPTEKYGGYNRPTTSFFVPVRYRVQKKTDILIMPVALLHAKPFAQDERFATSYAFSRLEQILGKPVEAVSFPLGKRLLKVNTIFELDGFKTCLAGSGGGRRLILSSLMPFAAGRETERYVKRLESFCDKRSKNEKLKCDPLHDNISPAENLQLYDLYVHKLSSSIYRKRINNPLAILEEGREGFIGLALEEQVQALLNIHAVFGRVSGGCDLGLVGGSKQAASTKNFSSSISNWKKSYTTVRIVDESASGLWFTKGQNLLELL